MHEHKTSGERTGTSDPVHLLPLCGLPLWAAWGSEGMVNTLRGSAVVTGPWGDSEGAPSGHWGASQGLVGMYTEWPDNDDL